MSDPEKTAKATHPSVLAKEIIVKLVMTGLLPITALVGCIAGQGSAVEQSAVVTAATPTTVQNTHQHQSYGSPDGFATIAMGEDRFELTFSGREFKSRDEIEGSLLYRAALLASERGHSWFRFLHLPGEGGPEVHPARPNPSFGAIYGHWQPHWSYYRPGDGWQMWKPESGARFWTDNVDVSQIERVEVHAMIEMGRGPQPSGAEAVFDALSVAKDLKRRFGRSPG